MKHEEWRANLRTVAKSAAGKIVLMEIIARCNTYGSVFSSDPLSMAYLEGQRFVGGWLRGDILDAAPESFMQMTLDDHNRRKKEQHDGNDANADE